MAKKSAKDVLQPVYSFHESWEQLLDNEAFVKAFLSEVLEEDVAKQRWYGGNSSKMTCIELFTS